MLLKSPLIGWVMDCYHLCKLEALLKESVFDAVSRAIVWGVWCLTAAGSRCFFSSLWSKSSLLYFLLRTFPSAYYCLLSQKRTKETVIITKQLQSRAIYSLQCGLVEIRDSRLQCGFKWNSCHTSWRLTLCGGRVGHSTTKIHHSHEMERPAFSLLVCSSCVL